MLRAFFETNMLVVLFGHGLVFFLLGFAIALQSRHTSRMTLARSLPLLGTFGLFYGVAEWGHLFIPIQSAYLSQDVIAVLQGLATVLLALAYVALFSFGARLLIDTTGRSHWLRWVPIGLFAVWFLTFMIVGVAIGRGDYLWWLDTGDLWSRYLLAFLGSALTCYALLLQRQEFRRLAMTPLLPYLSLAVLSFGLYAIAAGLLVPPGGFFPASVINADAFFAWTGLPIHIPRAVAGLVMTYSMVRTLEIFDIENTRRLEEAERMRTILEERDRISRDLHDGIIQSLYAVGLNLEHSLYSVDEEPAGAKQEIRSVMTRVNHVIRDIRTYIMDLRVSPGERNSVPDRLSALVEELRSSYKRPIDLLPADTGELRLEEDQINHVCQITREAVANAVRHADAANISVTLNNTGTGFTVAVVDDGVGFNPRTVKGSASRGHGLDNMEERARLLGGTVEVTSTPGRGTAITLHVPHDRTNGSSGRAHSDTGGRDRKADATNPNAGSGS